MGRATVEPDYEHPRLSVIPSHQLTGEQRSRSIDLCSRAFNLDFTTLFPLLDKSVDPIHVLAEIDSHLVGHAVWTTRWIQPAGTPALRTAYVDGVATEPKLWGHRIGSALINRLADETSDFDLRALSTNRVSFYQRLGWELWRGPSAVRSEGGDLVPTPTVTIMVHRTPFTPPLDLDSFIVADCRPEHPW